ncbi:hypothetical protein SEA_DRYAD_89 [Streptomyces phage Dryad]|nr:hypothetical protein SEA_DRYAD_89 [Streptomyces phage Dryad]
MSPQAVVDAPEWTATTEGALELYAAIKDEFPFMSDDCIWELVRTW